MRTGSEDGLEEQDGIADAAVAWLIERDEGLTPQRQAVFEQWCLADPRHAQAYARMQETWGILEELPGQGSTAAEPARAAGFPVRILGPLAAAALVMLTFGWWREARRNPHAHYATPAGQVQRIALPDGSTITLNAGSSVEVDFSSRVRRMELAAGEAHFDVAPDAARPFLVVAGGVGVRAVGTAFNVRLAGSSVSVLVTSGRVQLTKSEQLKVLPAGELTGSPLLEKGDCVVVPSGAGELAPKITRLEPPQMRQALAWQEEMLQFAETPLRDVIEQFNRHNRTQLRLGDPALGAKLIGGTFAADNVEAFVSLLERGGDLAVERPGGNEIILRSAR